MVRGSVKILIPVEKKIQLEDKNASRYVCKNMKHLVNRMWDRMMQPQDMLSEAFVRYDGGIKVKYMSEIQGVHGPLYGFGTSPLHSESVEGRWKATVIASEDTWLAKLSKSDFEQIENNLIK